MKNSNIRASATPRYSTYLYIAIVGFLVSLAVVYYYLQYVEGKVSGQTDQRIFYLILILFGISASALVFGVMNSYAVLKGEKLDAKYKFTGPIVGVILTVLGGFYLPKAPTEKIITIRAFDETNKPVKDGEVKLYLPGYIRSQSIDKMGQAQFTDIPESIISNKIRIDISSPGFLPVTIDTLLNYSSVPVQVKLSPVRMIILSGRVKDAGEIPIRNVEVNAEGTRFSGSSITDGTYTLQLKDYAVGDVVTLTTSHKDFEDKTVTLRITAPEMSNVDFVLKEIKSH
jgi:hypothetical protein